MHETRLALTIAGGVSLGAYEAGVLDELTWTLDELNRRHDNPQLGDAERRRYVIDIFTGGSAGSITGAIVAFAMLHDWPRARAMTREAWVKRVDIRKLLGDGKGLPPAGILDKHFLYELRDGLLLQRMTKPDDPVPVSGRASFCPDDGRPVHLHFSLSNLNGIDYSRQFANDQARLVTTFFRDEFRLTLDPASPLTWGQWQALTTAALASGTFPFAFPPEVLERTIEQYPGSDEPDDLRMSFVDGGIFDNEPLRAAFRAATEHDEGEDVKRVHVLIDPFVNVSKRKVGFGPDSELVAIAGRLITAIRGQASAMDFLKAGRRNNELNWTNHLLEAAQRALGKLDPAQAAEVERELDALLENMVAVKQNVDHGAAPSAPALVEDVNRSSTAEVAGGSPLVRKFVAAMTIAAGQQNKRPSDVHLIGARLEDLAGKGLGAFGGFFDEKFREHDYHVGRSYARERLPAILGCEPGDVPHEPGVPEGIPDHEKYANYELEQLKCEHLKEYNEVWKRAASAVTRGLKVPLIARPLVWLYARRKIRTMVEAMDD